MQEIIDLLKEYFINVNFNFTFDSKIKKWLVICNSLKVYFSEELKNVLEVVRNHYSEIKFFVVFQNNQK